MHNVIVASPSQLKAISSLQLGIPLVLGVQRDDDFIWKLIRLPRQFYNTRPVVSERVGIRLDKPFTLVLHVQRERSSVVIVIFSKHEQQRQRRAETHTRDVFKAHKIAGRDTYSVTVSASISPRRGAAVILRPSLIIAKLLYIT